MILTCPQCDTKYVVKDGAIPPAGRQVRCASCKHSWHQEPEVGAKSEVTAEPDLGGPPMPDADHRDDAHPGEIPTAAADDEMVGIAPPESDSEPDATAADGFAPARPDANYGLTAPSIGAAQAENLSDDFADVPLSETVVEDDVVSDDGDFAIAGFDEQESERSGRLFKGILIVVALVAIAVAAFWFLAPAEMRARVGLTAAARSPLKIMLDTRDRQKIASGNELLTISGRVLNPTDDEQPVPVIRAELRNRQSQKLIYSWTIRPQSRMLPPGSTTRFNSAEVDVPRGGDDISLSLGDE